MEIVDLKQIPEAIDLLVNWHHAEWSYLNPSLSKDQRLDKMDNYLTNQFIPSTFVAIDNENVLGSAAIVESDMDVHKYFTPWLASVYVDLKARGEGVGSELVKHVMSEAKRNGFQQLYLFTPDQAGFYEKLGWNLLFKESYRDNEVYVMRVEL